MARGNVKTGRLRTSIREAGVRDWDVDLTDTSVRAPTSERIRPLRRGIVVNPELIESARKRATTAGSRRVSRPRVTGHGIEDDRRHGSFGRLVFATTRPRGDAFAGEATPAPTSRPSRSPPRCRRQRCWSGTSSRSGRHRVDDEIARALSIAPVPATFKAAPPGRIASWATRPSSRGQSSS